MWSGIKGLHTSGSVWGGKKGEGQWKEINNHTPSLLYQNHIIFKVCGM